MRALQPLVGERTIEVPFASGSGTLSFQKHDFDITYRRVA